MARGGLPSMTALLGLLAVAGYQNRDKLAEMLGNRQGGMSGQGMGGQGMGGQGMGGQGMGGQGMGGLGGLLGSLAGGAGAGGLGGLLGGGLTEMSDHFRRQGRGEVVDSWVGTGANRQVEPQDLEAALGPEVLGDLETQTGLSRQEILSRLSRELPDAVDRYTPQGRIPTASEFG